MRQYNFIDTILMEAEAALSAMFADIPAQRPSPAAEMAEDELTPREQQQCAGLMRVNHAGEVAAQALYRGQMCVAQKQNTLAMLQQACLEERDHLSWTKQRLDELGAQRSVLNPLWYGNAFLLGFSAGLLGDQTSLGFVEETERQVGEHLQGHLGKLPLHDRKSRAIVTQMRQDELHHGQSAVAEGATPLPSLLKQVMRWQAKVMTTVAYYL